jgi:hypothetical protein
VAVLLEFPHHLNHLRDALRGAGAVLHPLNAQALQIFEKGVDEGLRELLNTPLLAQ